MDNVNVRVLAFASAMALSNTQVQAESMFESVNRALVTNPEIQIRLNSADARMDEIAIAEAGYLPRVDLTGGIGYERSRNSTTLVNYTRGLSDTQYADRTRREASITATQMLFDGESTTQEVNRQKARKRSADAEVCIIAERVGLNAIASYIDVLRNRELVDNAQENLAEHERIVELIRKKTISGLSSEADIAQADGRLVLAKANLITSESTLRDAEATFRRVIGNIPESFQSPQSPSRLPVSLENALQVAGRKHPVLNLANADVSAAEAQYEATKSSFMPRVELALGATWGRDQDGSKGEVYDHTALVRVNYNIYKGGADTARKHQTSKLLSEALEVKNRALRQVEEEVRLAWIAVSYGQDRLVSLTDHVEYTRKSRDLYKKQFQAGLRTLLDMLDSQNEYFNAVNTMLTGGDDLLFNQYRLQQSMGSLLTSINAEMPARAPACTGRG